MIVVADTSPLNYLIRLGHVNLLHHIYGRVLVPPAVLLEMQHPDAPPEVKIWAGQPPAWLEQAPVPQFDATLADELGMGERQAISLAIQLDADVLLIDERAGRQEAKTRNINIAGTLAVLLQASLRGYLKFPAELDRLNSLNFRASATVQADMLDRYNQAKSKANPLT